MKIAGDNDNDGILLLLQRPAASRYAMLPPLLPLLRRRQRCNPLPGCCHNPPPLCVSSSSASSFPFSLPAALFARRRSPTFNTQWLVVVCSCLLPSWSFLSLPAVQRLLMMSLLCHRRPAPLSLFGPVAVILVVVVVAGGGAGLSVGTKPWRRTSWCGHEAMAEDQLVLQR